MTTNADSHSTKRAASARDPKRNDRSVPGSYFGAAASTQMGGRQTLATTVPPSTLASVCRPAASRALLRGLGGDAWALATAGAPQRRQSPCDQLLPLAEAWKSR